MENLAIAQKCNKSKIIHKTDDEYKRPDDKTPKPKKHLKSRRRQYSSMSKISQLSAFRLRVPGSDWLFWRASRLSRLDGNLDNRQTQCRGDSDDRPPRSAARLPSPASSCTNVICNTRSRAARSAISFYFRYRFIKVHPNGFTGLSAHDVTVTRRLDKLR